MMDLIKFILIMVICMYIGFVASSFTREIVDEVKKWRAKKK